MLPIPTEPVTPDVVAQATAGDPRAQRAVLAHLLSWLPATARRMYGGNLDPEELSQDALTVVVRRIDSLSDPRKLDSWVLGILRRVAADHLKKRRRRPRIPVEDVELVAALSPDLPMPMTERRSPEADAWRREAVRIGEMILDELDDDAREAYVLHLEGWSQTEIAGLTDVPRGTVASRMRRAKRHIAEATVRHGLRPAGTLAGEESP
ncbi:MAG: RNA polymerase sigma factor [Alphaproteobacteria bacterium]|nr:RNA polymerase sigma factor [Alphaproteobacteria bacterium]